MKASDVPARDRILTATASILATRSFDSVGIREIATRANVNSQLIYHYFRDKRGLLRAVVEKEASRIRELLERAIQQTGSPRERLESFIGSWVTITVRDGASIRLVFRLTEQSDARHKRFVRNHSFRNAELMRSLIEEGIKAGEFRADVDPRYAAASLAGMVFFLATSGPVLIPAVGLGHETKLPEKMASHTVNLFLEGIAKRS